MTTQKQNSEVARPSSALEEVATPEVATPSPALEEVATPEVATPEVARPSPALGDAANPEVARPSPALEEVARPSPALGDAANPKVARPAPALGDAANPEVARPAPALGDAANPKVARPAPALGDAATPEVATPEVARPAPALGDVAQPSQSQNRDAFTNPSSSIGYFPGKSIYDHELLKTHRGENHLPHWELDETIYHVCFRLNDAVPKQKQEEWRYERELLQNLAKSQNRELSEDEKKRLQYLYSDKIEQYLDTGYGECLLKMPQFAQIVKQSLEFYNNVKYILHCWCIMPNHVHAAFKLLETGELPKVLHGWKSYTAHVINKLLGRSNALWQADYYNHIIRSGNEYYQQINYIWNNPDKAGLRNWPWRGKITKQN